jgi:hypothetical protein
MSMKLDREMEALKAVYDALKPLDYDARLRLLATVCAYFDLVSVETKREIIKETFAR